MNALVQQSADTSPTSDSKVLTFPFERDPDGAILFDPNRVRPFPENPRKKFRRIPQLAESIKACGQTEPGEVILLTGDPQWDAELVDGERRLRACKMAGVKFRAYPKSGIVNVDDQFERSFIANFGKEDHDCIEIAHGIKKIMDRKHRSLSEIARMAGKSITWAIQHLDLLKLHPKVQQMMIPAENEELAAERKLTFSLALLVVNHPHSFQIQAAKDITGQNMNLAKARRHILNMGRQAGRPIVANRRKPQAKFNSLMGLSENFRDQLGIFLDMKDQELDDMLRGIHEGAKITLLERLVEFDKELTQFIDVLQRKCNKPQ